MAIALQRPRMMPVCSDAELIQRTGAGDRTAFEKLYKRYARPVFGLALRRLGETAAGFWSHTPRSELGGRTPSQATRGDVGA